MDEALRLQKERERIHRWRASKRQAGNDALTIWLPRELKLYIEDMALKRHCSPSALVEQALTTCYPPSADVTDTVTDTSVTDPAHLRRMLQQDLSAFLARAEGVLDAIHTAERGTGTGTDTPQTPPRRRTRQPAPAD